ncbi:MAG: GNAT family N-acetyltransferase [Acidimicrobiales bacterium]
MIEVAPIDRLRPGDLEQVNLLLPQLSRSAPPLLENDLNAIIEAPETLLLGARDSDGLLVGMLTLVLFHIPTGPRAWIEDVVVDESVRGMGVGELLTRAAVVEAQRFGAKSVDLTSRPDREAANRLYQRCGFVRRETNVYRFS